MATSRARAGHARTKRAGVASRALAALAVVATATGTLVVSQVATPQAAQAAQEPAAGKIDVGEVSVWIDGGYTSETEGGAHLNDSIRYGVVTGMSQNRLLTDNKPVGAWLSGTTAKNRDAWAYIARGVPWKWDDQKDNTGPGDTQASKDWMQQHYNQWAASDKNIWVDGQSAIGFKPNKPGEVEPGQTFLLGAIRHNNLPIGQAAAPGGLGQPYLQGNINLEFAGLPAGQQREAFPFVNHETFNTLASTIIYRKGGAYVKTPGEAGTGTCSTSFGTTGWDVNQLVGGKRVRDLVLDGTYGRPGYTPSGAFIGPAYEPDPVNPADRSQG